MMRRTTAACVAFAMICIVAAQEPFDDVVPETLVQELNQDSEAMAITHECFEKTCGASGCSLAKMDCGEEAKAPWAVFVEKSGAQITHKLVHSQDLPEGALPVKTLKTPLDLNAAVGMPGMPTEASPKLLAAMKKADKLLIKITKLEKNEMKNDPLHKEDRGDLLKLIYSMAHMPAGPDKLKSTMLVFHLAKKMAEEEKKEQKKIDAGETVAATDGTIDSLLPDDDSEQPEDAATSDDAEATADDDAAEADIAAGGTLGAHMKPADAAKALQDMSPSQKKALVNSIVKVMVDKEEKAKGHMTKQEKKEAGATIIHMLSGMMAGGAMPMAAASTKPAETINGIPVGHQKCFMRACVHRVLKPNGHMGCGAAVISCGVNGQDPKGDTGKLSKQKALDLAKKSMGAFFPGAGGILGGHAIELHGAPSDMVMEMELP